MATRNCCVIDFIENEKSPKQQAYLKEFPVFLRVWDFIPEK